jgi:sugar phosphate isomerase/epimerase
VTEVALLATCWTTAGDAAPYPGLQASPIDLRVRIESAALAGFTGFGILDHDLRRFLATDELATLDAILRDNGMAHVELDFRTRWWADQFRALARQADEHGTRVALEFMPFSNVASLDCAMVAVAVADHPAGGLLLDVWHLERSGADPEDLRRVPIEAVLAVELDDGAAIPEGDPYDDTCLRRLLPGEGQFRVADFAAVLMSMGWSLPLGVEIISESYRIRDLDEAPLGVVRHTRAQLARASERAASSIAESTAPAGSSRGTA